MSVFPSNIIVKSLVMESYIVSADVERLFRSVDMAIFFPVGESRKTEWARRYLKYAPICIYALVMEYLNLKPGMSFLVLGSGVGYLNALAGLVLGPEGVNHGVEVRKDVLQMARSRTDEFPEPASFCRPEFFASVPSRTYDRVYLSDVYPRKGLCQSFWRWVKSLVKSDGELVYKGILVRTRKVKRDWVDTDMVHSADFFIPNNETYSGDNDSFVPRSLKDFCRSVIRKSLRPNIERPLERWGHPNHLERYHKPCDLCFEMFKNGGTPFSVSETTDWKRKVLDLPLPHTLKNYLNFGEPLSLERLVKEESVNWNRIVNNGFKKEDFLYWNIILKNDRLHRWKTRKIQREEISYIN